MKLLAMLAQVVENGSQLVSKYSITCLDDTELYFGLRYRGRGQAVGINSWDLELESNIGIEIMTTMETISPIPGLPAMPHLIPTAVKECSYKWKTKQL